MRSIRDIRNILGFDVKSSFLNAGPYCNLHPRNDIVSKPLHVGRACGSCRLSQLPNPYGL